LAREAALPDVRVDDLVDLWEAGAVKLPQVAVQYAELAQTLHQTGLSESAAFSRSTGGLGPLHPVWTGLRTTIQDKIVVGSYRNLIAAGRVLTEIAAAYATTDHLNADQLGQYQRAITGIQNSANPDGRPPSYVPDPPTSDDPHPEDEPARVGGI
jgi:hypothetical protein